MNRIYRFALGGLAVNIAFSVYYVIAGLNLGSWWLLTLGAYYSVLSIIKFTVLRSKIARSVFIKRLSGIMLMVMSVPLAGTVILSNVKDRGTAYHEIVMISIAVYAFTKITLASVNLAKSKKAHRQR